MNKAIQIKAQKRYENPVYMKLKKYENYVTPVFLKKTLQDYDAAVSIKTNGNFFDSDHKRISAIVDILAEYCGIAAQYISIGDETVLGVYADIESNEYHKNIPLHRLNKKQQKVLEKEGHKNLCLGCLLVERFVKLVDARASVKVRVYGKEYLYGRFAVDIVDFDSKIEPYSELYKVADSIPMKIEKKVDDFVDLIFSQGSVKRKNTEALFMKQKVLAFGFDLIWHFPGDGFPTQSAKRENFWDIEDQPKQTLNLGEYGEITLKKNNNEVQEIDETPFMRKVGNDLSEMGKQYHSSLSYYVESYIDDTHYEVLSKLNKLSIDESQLYSLTPTNPYYVGTTIPKTSGMGAHSGFMFYWEKEINEETLLRSIRLEMSEQGAWQLYLLKTTHYVMPTYWHGEYMKRKYIFDEYDLYGIMALRDYDLTDLIACPIIWPSVTVEPQIEKSLPIIWPPGTFEYPETEYFVAHVFCCYWNDWKGLIREHVKITLKNGRVDKYEILDDFVIYKYHCGIFM